MKIGKKRLDVVKSINAIMVSQVLLELFHQILSHSPHSCSLAVYVHGNRKEHTAKLNTSNGQEGVLAPARLKPVWEKE